MKELHEQGQKLENQKYLSGKKKKEKPEIDVLRYYMSAPGPAALNKHYPWAALECTLSQKGSDKVFAKLYAIPVICLWAFFYEEPVLSYW